MTWEKSWLCLKPTYYALTQHGYVHQIRKQLKSITLGCKDGNVKNTYLSVVSHCVVTHTNQVFWQNLGMMGHFSWLGARKKSRGASAAKIRKPDITPSTQSNLFPKLICFFYVETHKVSTSIRGGFHVLLHKKFLEQVHSARSSCTADARPLNGFENGLNLAENRIEYVLLTTWDGNSIYFSANRARPIAKVTVKWVYRMEFPYE